MAHANFISQPTSGTYREKIIDVHAEDSIIRPWCWVLFSKEDCTEWVASLHGGENTYRHVESVGNIAFVVADGQGYLIDVQKEELIRCTDERTIRSVVADEQNGLFAYTSDEGYLFLIDKLLVPRSTPIPLQFYTIQLDKLVDKSLLVTYEERTTGEFTTVWINLTEPGSTIDFS